MKQLIKQIEKDFLIYNSSDWDVKVSVLLINETIWLNKKSMWSLFWCSSDNIWLHLKNIFKTWELSQKSVTEDFSVTATDWKIYNVKHFNLDAIISVWYRVNSIEWTKFRIWATNQLRELIIKWFVIDEEKLKNPDNSFWNDYFELLEEKISDIRTSERRFYQKITDIYALSVDYNKNSRVSKNFFATVQNKLHFWIHWKTAAELIFERADSKKEKMWITCVPENAIKKSDIFIAKNYLTQDEISELNLIVEQYLAFAKNQARKKIAMTMKDWILKLDDFLRLNEKEILENFWDISRKIAEEKVEREYEIYKHEKMKNYISDFDEFEKLLN